MQSPGETARRAFTFVLLVLVVAAQGISAWQAGVISSLRKAQAHSSARRSSEIQAALKIGIAAGMAADRENISPDIAFSVAKKMWEEIAKQATNDETIIIKINTNDDHPSHLSYSSRQTL